VWDETFLILAFRNMLPQSFHTGTVRRDRTIAIFVLTLGGMTKQQETLLLMPQDLLSI